MEKSTGEEIAMNELTFKTLDMSNIEEITALFQAVFTAEPWNDDWSDVEQLNMYLRELVEPFDSLTFGVYRKDELAGISLGRIRHWYSGTEYYIDELCIKTEIQGQGIGSFFMAQIEKELQKRHIDQIFLQTDSDVPAYGFYKKRGFNELTTHVSFYKNV